MAQYIDTVRAPRARPLRLARVEHAPADRTPRLGAARRDGGLVAYGLWAIAGITRHDIPDNASYYVVRQLVFACAGVVLDGRSDPHRPAVLPPLQDAALHGDGRDDRARLRSSAPSRAARGAGSTSASSASSPRSSRSSCSSSSSRRSSPIAEADRGHHDAVARDRARDPAGAARLPAAGPRQRRSSTSRRSAPCLFVAGVRWLHLAILAGVVVFVASAVLWFLPSVGVDVLKPYQKDRLIGFSTRTPIRRGARTTYGSRSPLSARAASAAAGVDEATQTRLDYLPEHATDFAFARSPSSAASSAPRCSCSSTCSSSGEG